MTKIHPTHSRQRQKGAVLAISMIFLIIVTLIGVYAANTATMDVRMARNMQAQMESVQAAEAGLNAALETLAPTTGVLLFTQLRTPTSLDTGTLLNNLYSGGSDVAVSINYVGTDSTPRQLPSGCAGGSTGIGYEFHRIVSGAESSDASATVGMRVSRGVQIQPSTCYSNN